MKRLSLQATCLMAALFATSCNMNMGGDEPIPTKKSPFISNVFDYSPAAGQFVNTLPQYSAGSTKQMMATMAARSIVGVKEGQLVTLGGYGGSITFGFDHMIENREGLRDFRILGNAFNNSPDASIAGGSSEPGIVYVSYDANNNGLPDDEWYEIAGSEYSNSASIRNYQITYHRPPSETEPNQYLKWTDNQNASGYLQRTIGNAQSYFPSWISENSIAFTGALLPPNAVDAYGDGALWVLKAYGFGYADNAPNSHHDSAIDISWAVDKKGMPVNLKGINFVKVVTGVNQQCGWIGETSTEICGAYDLHLLNETIASEIK